VPDAQLDPEPGHEHLPAEGIGAPIRDEDGNVVAAVSVAALASRVYPEAEAEAEFAQQVLATAREISAG
jgi:DNA-binding IclR family transcriptional regulator